MSRSRSSSRAAARRNPRNSRIDLELSGSSPAFIFPPSPALGQEVINAFGSIYAWDGVKWIAAGSIGNAIAIVGPSPPPNPVKGLLWWDSQKIGLYCYYAPQWVSAGSSGGRITIGPIPPANPIDGDLWWDSVNVGLYMWDANAWVSTGGVPGGGGRVTLGAAPPANPDPGDLWWDTVNVGLYLWNGNVWIGTAGLTAINVDAASITGDATTANPLAVQVVNAGTY